jgi:hypothetical protein
MEPKEKRNKEVFTARVKVPAGTRVRDLLTGFFFVTEEPQVLSGWYLKEKGQWFYWTLFYKYKNGGESLVMIRRDFVEIQSGTHRTCHREVVQKKMSKILSKNTFEHMVLPKPPRIGRFSEKENCSPEWQNMYRSFHVLAKDRFIPKPWSPERIERMEEIKKLRALKKQNEEQEPTQSLEDEETPELE